MGSTRQANAQYVFGPANGGGDIIHFRDAQGAPNSWIDASGIPQGNLAQGASVFSGSPSGSCTSGQTAVDSVSGKFYNCFSGTWNLIGPGAGASLSTNNTWTGTNTFATETIFQGPNPYVDIRSYGAVGTGASSNVAPQVRGITATINSGSPNATISSASTFVNGMGVVIQGAGATNSMSTPVAPTVTQSLARSGTHTGDVVDAPAGATAYNYKIIAQEIGLGYTAASTAGSTIVGTASLGYQTVNITSCNRANGVVTCLSEAHGLSVGAEIRVIGASDISFNGEFVVATVPDSTHFTWVGPQDTRNGAVVSSTGGTVNYWQCNHLTWSAVTGAFRYFIYCDRAVPGTFALIGVSQPSLGSFTEGSLYFDDFGSPLMDGFVGPWSIPTTAPGAATNDSLVTTITSGAGTTTLVLANNASNSVAGVNILSDAAPNILAAAMAASGVTTYIPFGQSFVTNSILDLTSVNPGISIGGGLVARDTIILGSLSTYAGQPQPSRSGALSFTFESLPQTFLGGHPGLYFNGQGGNVKRVQIIGSGGNGQTILMTNGGGGGPGNQIDTVSIGTGLANDAMSIPWYARGQFSQTAAQFFVKALTIVTTQGQHTATPALYAFNTSNPKIDSIFLSGRGLMFRADSTGGSVDIAWLYCQGCATPLVTMAGYKNQAGNAGMSLTLNQYTNDTSNSPIISLLPSLGSVNLDVQVGSGSGSASIGYSGAPAIFITGINGQTLNNTSFLTGSSIDGIFNPTNAVNPYAVQMNNNALATSSSYPIFVDSPGVTNLVAAVAAGGAVPNGTFTYAVYPVWPNGGDGHQVGSNQVTTTTGNNTVNLTWTALGASAGCTGYRIARGSPTLSNAQILGANSFVAGCGTASASDSTFFTGGQASSITAGGPSMLMPGIQGVAAPKLILGPGGIDNNNGTTFANLGTPSNGRFIYCSDCTIANPCVGSGNGAFAKRLNGVWVCN